MDVVWDKVIEFGSSPRVPCAILDRALTFISDQYTRVYVTGIQSHQKEICDYFVQSYHAFKQVWCLKITIIVNKYVHKHLRVFANFLKHSASSTSQIVPQEDD